MHVNFLVPRFKRYRFAEIEAETTPLQDILLSFVSEAKEADLREKEPHFFIYIDKLKCLHNGAITTFENCIMEFKPDENPRYGIEPNPNQSRRSYTAQFYGTIIENDATQKALNYTLDLVNNWKEVPGTRSNQPREFYQSFEFQQKDSAPDYAKLFEPAPLYK